VAIVAAGRWNGYASTESGATIKELEKKKKLKNKGQNKGEAGESIRCGRSRVEGKGKDVFISVLSATTWRG
jgi:hypothetical protein